MYFKMLPLTDQHCAYIPELFGVKEGLSGGLFLNCANCSVNNSEVYGFSTFNILVGPDNVRGSPIGRGTVNITNSLIGNYKIEESKIQTHLVVGLVF